MNARYEFRQVNYYLQVGSCLSKTWAFCIRSIANTFPDTKEEIAGLLAISQLN